MAWPGSEVLTRRPGWPVEPGAQDVLNRRNWPVVDDPGDAVPRQRPGRGAADDADTAGRRSGWLGAVPAQGTSRGFAGRRHGGRRHGGRVDADVEDTAGRCSGWLAEAGEVPAQGGAKHASWPSNGLDAPVAREGAAKHAAPVWPAEQDEPAQPRHAAEPGQRRKTISSDMVLDTVPMGRVKHRRKELSSAIVYALPDTPPSGLRKFDLGTVPASVTPPRTWRKAAWFAVGTSAAVVLGLAVASAELMGRPVDEPMIDALPSYPTGPLTLEKLPNEQTPTDLPGTTKNKPTTSDKPSTGDLPNAPQPDTVVGNTSDLPSQTDPGTSAGTTPGGPTTATTPAEPTRVTVGPRPLTPTDPQKMGDSTEEYFRLVTTDPEAAHAMTTGGMAREGAEGIEARYVGVERVEVQEITIDRSQATTTSTVKVVHEDGTETIEERQLTFTGGGDPKITADSTTG
jgi:hypothetical protein